MNICNRSAFIILMLSTSSAMAQTAPFPEDAQADAAAAAQGAGGQIEEIVVTAQKRAENIQRVPIAISALGGEALANKAFDSLGIGRASGRGRVCPYVSVSVVDAEIEQKQTV